MFSKLFKAFCKKLAKLKNAKNAAENVRLSIVDQHTPTDWQLFLVARTQMDEEIIFFFFSFFFYNLQNQDDVV